MADIEIRTATPFDAEELLGIFLLRAVFCCYVVQFLSEAVAMPRMAEFCAVLHQVLMGLLYHGKLKKL